MIFLTDEQGIEKEYEPVELIELDGEEYALLIPSDELGAEEVELMILQVTGQDGDQITELSSVEDPEILEAVYEIFERSQLEPEHDHDHHHDE